MYTPLFFINRTQQGLCVHIIHYMAKWMVSSEGGVLLFMRCVQVNTVISCWARHTGFRDWYPQLPSLFCVGDVWLHQLIKSHTRKQYTAVLRSLLLVIGHCCCPYLTLILHSFIYSANIHREQTLSFDYSDIYTYSGLQLQRPVFDLQAIVMECLPVLFASGFHARVACPTIVGTILVLFIAQ